MTFFGMMTFLMALPSMSQLVTLSRVDHVPRVSLVVITLACIRVSTSCVADCFDGRLNSTVEINKVTVDIENCRSKKKLSCVYIPDDSSSEVSSMANTNTDDASGSCVPYAMFRSSFLRSAFYCFNGTV